MTGAKQLRSAMVTPTVAAQAMVAATVATRGTATMVARAVEMADKGALVGLGVASAASAVECSAQETEEAKAPVRPMQTSEAAGAMALAGSEMRTAAAASKAAMVGPSVARADQPCEGRSRRSHSQRGS